MTKLRTVNLDYAIWRIFSLRLEFCVSKQNLLIYFFLAYQTAIQTSFNFFLKSVLVFYAHFYIPLFIFLVYIQKWLQGEQEIIYCSLIY